MALNLMKAPTFGGEVNENPEEWINEFDRLQELITGKKRIKTIIRD